MIPGVGPITALTWALEIGDYTRFQSVKEAISCCGLCSAEKSSADKVMRMPISKPKRWPTRQSLEKPFLIRKNKNGITRCAGCQVPQLTGWARKATSYATFGLFRDWRRTQT
jgi:hypothetical protein